jgi:hypothetical protein
VIPRNKRLIVTPEPLTRIIQLPDGTPDGGTVGIIQAVAPGSDFKVGQRIAYNRAETILIDGEPVILVPEESVLVVLG